MKFNILYFLNFILFSLCIKVSQCQIPDSITNSEKVKSESIPSFHLGINVGGGRYFPNSNVNEYIENGNMPIVEFEIGLKRVGIHIKHYNFYGEIIKDLVFDDKWIIGYITICSITELGIDYEVRITNKFSITPSISIGQSYFVLSDSMYHKKYQSDFFYNTILGLNTNYILLSLGNVKSDKPKRNVSFSTLDLLLSSSFTYIPNYYYNFFEIKSGNFLIGLKGALKFNFSY